MDSFKKVYKIAGAIVLLFSFVVFAMTAERTGSLWDCGEFILGAYKLQVVHPPGAAIFLLVGRLFTWIATIVSDNPADIAFAVNLMSGLCTALAAMLVCWITMIFGKLALVGREGTTDKSMNLALGGAGLAAGLTAAFCTSVWFSAVEGEVYAMSTFFTALTFWAAVKWYALPDEKDSDRWLVLSLFAAGLSVGVHLLSILALPTVALLYYFKKYENHNIKGVILSLLAGVGMVIFILKIVIVNIPTLWKNMELFTVNSLGMPFHTGLIPTVLIIGGIAYLLLRLAQRQGYHLLHLLTVAAILITVAFSSVGVIVIRANSDTPINMNVPSDAMRLLPYLNREQYGERPLLKGPHFDANPTGVKKTDRYGRVGDKYEIVEEKFDYEYKDSDLIFFPRIGHSDPGRRQLHRMWQEYLTGKNTGRPDASYNLSFMRSYQLGWMYWRYFMWNFAGRQNGEQGYFPWDVKSGHWESGIKAIDEARLYNMDQLTDTMKNHRSKNHYYFIPLIFGLIGLIFHFSKNRKDFLALFILFTITGIGIIIYSNQPPNEPRERDYVLVGSFITYAMWLGMAVLAIYSQLKKKTDGMIAAGVGTALVLIAPMLMLIENFDDHDRSEHYASRDYAANFLESVEKDAIIFTYGDNDTYPLWYAQEVENIRRDVRVVNLSLIAVDWYIDKLRSKVNDSPPINLTLSEEAYRGKNRNQVFFHDPRGGDLNRPLDINRALRIIGDPKNGIEGTTIINSKKLFIPVDLQKYMRTPFFNPADTFNMTSRLDLRFSNSNYFTKDDLAVIDVIASNIYDRPLYFATTCKNDKLLGLNDYMKPEGLALRITPYKNRSDGSFPAVYGSGRINVNRSYDIMMNKWKWGNFDNKELFVDNSYGAQVQAMKLMMLRTALSLSALGDKKRAGDIANKYFEGFPHFNFPYDASILPFIDVLIQAKDFESAKKHMRILGEETVQNIAFYESLDQEDLQTFEQDLSFAIKAAMDIVDKSKEVEDPAFEKEMEDLLSRFNIGDIIKD